MDEQTINLVNVYAPNTDVERRTFFLILELFIARENETIFGGDFNSIMDNRLDKLGRDPNSRQAATYFLRPFYERYDLCDIWREQRKDERNYTWTGRMTSNHLFIPTRTDFFLTSRALNQFITAVEIKPYAHSDHDCITLEIDFDKVHRGLAIGILIMICLATLFSTRKWSSFGQIARKNLKTFLIL